MVTKTGYKIIKKAVILRLKIGEDIETILASYPKLSEAQVEQLLQELKDEGYIS
jgi:uncharacterized protein (DUF433 family)